MQLLTEIITKQTVFTELRSEWLDLLSRSVTNYVFQTPQFQGAWWDTLSSGKLRVVTVRTQEGKLVGLAPFCLNTTKTGGSELCFVGCVNVSDYLDILVDPQYQADVYKELEIVLKESLTDWDSIYLCSLPESSPTRKWISSVFPVAKESQQDVSPSIQLPQSWEEYLASIDRKQRHEIKRKMRRVEEVEHHYEVVTTKESAIESMPDFIKLHKASSAEKQDFWDDNHLTFFNTFIPMAAEANWLKLFFLQIEGTRVAAMLVFEYESQFLLYNSGYDPSQYKHLSTGNVLTAYTIQTAIAHNMALYDFLRGDEQYKFRFGAVAHPVFDISVSR